MEYKEAYLYLFNQLTNMIETIKTMQAKGEELVINTDTDITWFPGINEANKLFKEPPDTPFVIDTEDDS